MATEMVEVEAGPTGIIPVEPSVSGLVALAIEKGVPVEVLERLVALQERVTERNARSSFIEAMAAFHAECPPIIKTRENTQFSVTRDGAARKARYAPLEEIDRVARPVAARHGLVWTWDTRVEADLMHITCRVTHTLGHSETAVVSMPYGSNAGSSPQQKYGSTQTYGMRYSLIAALGITTADDDRDGAGADGPALTENEADSLDSLMVEVACDRAKFLAWLGVESIAEIKKKDLPRAIAALEQRRRRA